MPSWASDAIHGAESLGSSVVSGAANLAGSAWNTASSAASTAWGGITSAGSAVLGGLTSAAQAAFGWVRGAWDRLRSFATSAVSSLRSTLSSGIDAVRRAATSAWHGVAEAWNSARSAATSLVNAAKQRATGFLGGLLSTFGAIAGAITSLDGQRLSAAWRRLVGVAGALGGAVAGVVNGTRSRITQGWQRLTGLAGRARSAIASLGGGLLGRLRGAAASLQSRASGMWDSIVGRVTGVLSHLPGWSSIQRMWSSVWGGIRSAASTVTGAAQSAWGTITRTASSAWTGIQQGVGRARDWVSGKLGELVSGASRIAGAIKADAVGGLVHAFTQLKELFQHVREAIRNPKAMVMPMANAIVAQLSVLPGRVHAEAEQRVRERASAGGGAASAPGSGGGGGSGGGASAMLVQRAPAAATGLTTLSVGDTLSTFGRAFVKKLSDLGSKLLEQVANTLLSMVWPPATIDGLKQDWSEMTKELSTRVGRSAWPRLDSFAHFWVDIRRFVSNILDFPLIIWRSANAMLGRLYLYIALAMILVGALFDGIGAAAGAKAALELGKYLLYSYVAAEVASFAKSVGDLLFVPQTPDEQAEDANQSANSIIGLAIAGILAALLAAAARLARGIVSAIRARLTPADLPPPKELPPPDTTTNDQGNNGGTTNDQGTGTTNQGGQGGDTTNQGTDRGGGEDPVPTGTRTISSVDVSTCGPTKSRCSGRAVSTRRPSTVSSLAASTRTRWRSSRASSERRAFERSTPSRRRGWRARRSRGCSRTRRTSGSEKRWRRSRSAVSSAACSHIWTRTRLLCSPTSSARRGWSRSTAWSAPALRRTWRPRRRSLRGRSERSRTCVSSRQAATSGTHSACATSCARSQTTQAEPPAQRKATPAADGRGALAVWPGRDRESAGRSCIGHPWWRSGCHRRRRQACDRDEGRDERRSAHGRRAHPGGCEAAHGSDRRNAAARVPQGRRRPSKPRPVVRRTRSSICRASSCLDQLKANGVTPESVAGADDIQVTNRAGRNTFRPSDF